MAHVAEAEDKDLVYVLRALELLMSSGIGLEAAIHSLSKGGYGRISKDFKQILDNVGKGAQLERELRRVMSASKSKGYKRLLDSLVTNVRSNTNIVETLRVQGGREEDIRNEKVAKYIEDLGGLPVGLLSIVMIFPIILPVLAIAPSLFGNLEGVPGIDNLPGQAQMMNILIGGLGSTLLLMALIGMKAHTKDPGL